jgi:hypothetical protein
MLSAICELVSKGLSVNHAAQKLHVHHSTVAHWRREMPDFDAAILAAEAEFIDGQVANIRTAATKNWQAAAWLLERRWPAFYAQPQVQFNLPGAKPEFDDFPALLEKLRQSPAYLADIEEEESKSNESPRLHGDSIIDVPALPAHYSDEKE